MNQPDMQPSEDGPTKSDKVIMWMFFAAVAIGLGFGAWALLMPR